MAETKRQRGFVFNDGLTYRLIFRTSNPVAIRTLFKPARTRAGWFKWNDSDFESIELGESIKRIWDRYRDDYSIIEISYERA